MFRRFDWHSETAFDERGETRSYELALFESVDLFALTWMGPSIAPPTRS